jgi:hypothetical protein
MRPIRNLGIIALILAAASPALAEVTLRATQGRTALAVPVSRARAEKMLAACRSLTRGGACEVYLNLWKGKNSRSWPQGQDGTLVVKVNNKDAWLRNFATETVGFQCNGTPQAPGYSGNVRVGEWHYSYAALHYGREFNHGAPTRPVNVRDDTYHTLESTFQATPAEVKAMNAFYMARANGLVLDPRTNEPHMPEWINPGTSNYKQEGCAGASTSIFNADWQTAFEYSIPHIQRQAGDLPEFRGLTADAVRDIRNFQARYGLRQEETPKTLVREFGLRPQPMTALGGMITIRDTGHWNSRDHDPAELTFTGNIAGRRFAQYLDFDRSPDRNDGDMTWTGMGKYPSFPDRSPTDKKSSSYQNIRVENPEQLLEAALR